MGCSSGKVKWIDPGVPDMHYGYAEEPIASRIMYGTGLKNPTCVRVLDYFRKADEQVQTGPHRGDVEIKPVHRLSQRLLVTDAGDMDLMEVRLDPGIDSIAELPLKSLFPTGFEPGALLDPGHVFPVGEMQGFFVCDNNDVDYGSPRVQGFSCMEVENAYTLNQLRAVTAVTNSSDSEEGMHKPLGVAFYPPLRQLAVTDYRRHKILLYELVRGQDVARVITRLDRVHKELRRQHVAENERQVKLGLTSTVDEGENLPRAMSTKVLRRASVAVDTPRTSSGYNSDDSAESETQTPTQEAPPKELDRITDMREAGVWRLLLEIGNYHNMPAAQKVVQPAGCDINSRGILFVCSSGNHRIQLYSPEGRWLEHWGAGLLNTPMDVTLDEFDNLFVVDTGNNCIRLFSRTGEPLTSWGSRGFTEWNLLAPCSATLYTKHDPELCTAQARAMRVWEEAAIFPEYRAEQWHELRKKGYDIMWDDRAGEAKEEEGGKDGDGDEDGDGEKDYDEEAGSRSAYQEQLPLGDPSNDDEFDTLVQPDNEPRLFVEPLRMLTAPPDQLEAWVVENSPLVSKRLQGIGRHLVADGMAGTSPQATPRRLTTRSSTLHAVQIHGKDKDPYSALSDLAAADVTPLWPSTCDCDRCLIICDGGNRRVLEWTLFRLSGKEKELRQLAKKREKKIERDRARREARRRKEELLKEAKRRQQEAEESREARVEQLRKRASKAARAATSFKAKDDGERQVGLLYLTSTDPISGAGAHTPTGLARMKSADQVRAQTSPKR